jgi:hypothetical protein
MSSPKRPLQRSIATLASLAFGLYSACCGAQVRLGAPPPPPPTRFLTGPSPPNAASVMEASARAASLIPRPPLVASELATLQPMMVVSACFPVAPVYTPHNLLPASFSSSQTTPYPQATWAPPTGPYASNVVNYVIQRAILNTTTWTTVATTCGGAPSIWLGVPPDGSRGGREVNFVDTTGGLQPATTYVYKVTAVDSANHTDWSSFKWTSQPVLPTIQVTNYQHTGSSISLTAAQFYNVAGQVVDSAQQLLVAPSNIPPFTMSEGKACSPGSYGLVCQVNYGTFAGATTSVALTYQWGLYMGDGFHVLAQSGISMPTP